jgi:hypothetical protein
VVAVFSFQLMGPIKSGDDEVVASLPIFRCFGASPEGGPSLLDSHSVIRMCLDQGTLPQRRPSLLVISDEGVSTQSGEPIKTVNANFDISFASSCSNFQFKETNDIGIRTFAYLHCFPGCQSVLGACTVVESLRQAYENVKVLYCNPIGQLALPQNSRCLPYPCVKDMGNPLDSFPCGILSAQAMSMTEHQIQMLSTSPTASHHLQQSTGLVSPKLYHGCDSHRDREKGRGEQGDRCRL